MRLIHAAWEAHEVVTGVAVGLLGSSATGDAFLQLLGDALYGFQTYVEHPEECLLLRERNESVPLRLDIAAEKADHLRFLCHTTTDALVTERHLLANYAKDRNASPTHSNASATPRAVSVGGRRFIRVSLKRILIPQ